MGGMPGGMGGMPGGMGGMGGMPNMGGMPGGMGGMPGGMGGMPGGMGGMDPNFINGLMSDPDLQAAMGNPKVMAAMQDVMKNPGNIGKYQNDPETMGHLMKIMQKFGGGMGGGMP